MYNVLDLWLNKTNCDNLVISGDFTEEKINWLVSMMFQPCQMELFPEHNCYSMNDILSFLKKFHKDLYLTNGCFIITNSPEIIHGLSLISERLRIDVKYYQYTSKGELNDVSDEINKIFIYLAELLHKEMMGEDLLSHTITC